MLDFILIVNLTSDDDPHLLQTGEFSLHVLTNDKRRGKGVVSYRIRRTFDGGYTLDAKKRFETVQELLQHYQGIFRHILSTSFLPHACRIADSPICYIMTLVHISSKEHPP